MRKALLATCAVLDLDLRLWRSILVEGLTELRINGRVKEVRS